MFENLAASLGSNIDLEQIQPDVVRLYAPFFHEDGDMYSIYLQANDNYVLIRDFGNTLMRVAYTFDLDTENKQSILRGIVKSNAGELDDGEIILRATHDTLPQAILQYSQIVSKVSNITILRRETVRSLFYDYLREFTLSTFARNSVQERLCPTSDEQLVVDFAIPSRHRPIYLFGVNENTKASKVVISCLTFHQKKLPFRSVIVNEDPDALSKFNRNQLMNAADKQFASLDDFKSEGEEFIQRELAS